MFPPCSAQFRLVYPKGISNRSVYPVIRRIVEFGCTVFAARSIPARFTSRTRANDGVLCLVRSAVRQLEDSCLFPRVIERMKPPDFIETTNGIEGVEKTCVAGCKLTCLEVTATQVRIAKCLGTLPREKVKAQPAAVRRRDPLRFPEKG